jgi:hypothetical protein
VGKFSGKYFFGVWFSRRGAIIRGPRDRISERYPTPFLLAGTHILGLFQGILGANGIPALDKVAAADLAALQLVATDQVAIGTLLASSILHRIFPDSSQSLFARIAPAINRIKGSV